MVCGVVVVAEALVAGQAGGHALVATVHGHQVDVDVDQQVALRGPPVDLDVLALVGEPQVDQRIGVLGVVLGQQAVGGEGVVDAVAQGVAELGFGHPSVEGQGHDQGHVVHAGLGRHVQDLFDDHLADIGPLHGRQGQRDVVEGDGQLHPRPQEGGQGVAVAHRMGEGRADGRRRIWERIDGLGGVDDPAALGETFEAEPLAVPEQRGRRGAVDVEHESGPGAHRVRPFGLRRSKTTFTAPRRPAAPAWPMASS